MTTDDELASARRDLEATRAERDLAQGQGEEMAKRLRALHARHTEAQYRLTMALQRLDETETLMGDLVAQRGGTTPRAVIAQLKANLELRKLCATPLPEEVRG